MTFMKLLGDAPIVRSAGGQCRTAGNRQNGEVPTPMSSPRVISPNIFDVYANPEIVYPLVLANLLCERTWSLSTKLPAASTLDQRLRGYQKVIDKYFTHLTTGQVAEQDGLLNVALEQERLGPDVVAAALENIERTLRWRTERKTIYQIESTLALMEGGQFPAFTYAPIDVLHAQLSLTGVKANRSIAFTSCLDEAAIFLALTMTGVVDELDGVVVLGTASHYTVFCWSGEPAAADFNAWWFYGKNRIFDLSDYRRLIRDEYAGDALLAFADRLPWLDTVIGRDGSWRFGSHETSFSSPRVASIVAAMDAFFGARLRELDAALKDPLTFLETTPAETLFAQCLNLSDAAAVRHLLLQTVSSRGSAAQLAQDALLSYRSVDGVDDARYGENIHEGPHLAAARDRVVAAADPLAEIDTIVNAVTGELSIFNEVQRRTMPEEVLRYNTGTPGDRELLRTALAHFLKR